MCRIVSLLGLLCLTSAIALAQGSAPLVLEAACDAGDDLNRVLREAEVLARGGFVCGPPFGGPGDTCVTVEARPVQINVSGTCNGPIGIQADNLTLRGVGNAVIQHDPGQIGEMLRCYAVPCAATIHIAGATNVTLENLTVRGAGDLGALPFGVELYALMSAVKIHNCEFEAGEIGLWADSSLLEVSDSTVDIDGSEGTVVGNAGSHLRLLNTELMKGVTLIDSDGSMDGGRITTSSVHVIYLFRNSRLDVTGSELAGLYVRAQDNSHVGLHGILNNIQGVTAERFSSMDISVTGPVNVGLYDHSEGILDGEIDGSVSLSTFSSLRLDGDLTGSLTCSEVSDAVCSGISGASTCGHCPGTTAAATESSTEPAMKATASRSAIVGFINGVRPESADSN